MRDDEIIQAERKTTQGTAAVYMYLFTWESPAFGGKYGSCHTFDVPFVFDNVDAASQLYGPSPDPRRYELAASVSKSWAAFAHRGDPTHSGIPKWEPYTVNERATMVLNYSCELVRDPLRDDRMLFAQLRSSRIPKIKYYKMPS